MLTIRNLSRCFSFNFITSCQYCYFFLCLQSLKYV